MNLCSAGALVKIRSDILSSNNRSITSGAILILQCVERGLVGVQCTRATFLHPIHRPDQICTSMAAVDVVGCAVKFKIKCRVGKKKSWRPFPGIWDNELNFRTIPPIAGRVGTLIRTVAVVVDLGFTMLLTSQIISIAFYSEREKSNKFCSEVL